MSVIVLEGVDMEEAFAAIVAAKWPLVPRLLVGSLNRFFPVYPVRKERPIWRSWVPVPHGPRGRSPPENSRWIPIESRQLEVI